MPIQEYVSIGFAKKPHGVKGEIKVDIPEAHWDDLEATEVLFLEVAGKKVPYFIEWIRGAAVPLLKLESIDTPEAAQTLCPGNLFIREEDRVGEKSPDNSSNLQYHFLEGYRAFDKIAGEIGFIDAILDYPQQEMAEIRKEGKTILIPIHEELIVQLDEKQQLIYFDLPEGLLDI
jgi:16S rRNA processing protein RimM